MDSSFRTLKKDHVYFRQLLDELDRQTTRCRNGEQADWALIDHIVNTLCHYPEQCHHPMEDDFLVLLKSRHWISDMVIDTLHRDHKRLHQLGSRTQAQLSPVRRPEDSEAVGHTLDVLDSYVAAYRDHIRTEEELVFPMVEKLIAASRPEQVGASEKSSLAGQVA